MTIKLCGFRISNYHNKVRLVLLEKGIAHVEDAHVMPSQKPEFLARSPLGKVPFLEVDGQVLTESQVICDYLEDVFPEHPLYPADPLAKARVRELITYIELHLELVARRLYGAVFFGGELNQDVRAEVERDLAKGLRGFQQLVKFSPFIAGDQLTIADCSAFVNLPLISMATRSVYGKGLFETVPQVKPYLIMLGERAAFAQVSADRKAAADAAAAAKKKSS